MALSRHHAALNRPLSVHEIVNQAQDFEFSTGRSLQAWLRSSRMLLTEAGICERDGNLQMAFLYLYRHSELVLGKLPKHPDSRDPRFKSDLAEARRTVQQNLAKLEQWKPRIDQDYQRYSKSVQRRNEEKQRLERKSESDRRRSISGDVTSLQPAFAEDETFDNLSRTLNAREHRQLAVQLAQNELRRREHTKQNTVSNPRAGIHDPRRVPERGERSQLHRYPNVPAKEEPIDWKRPDLRPETVINATVSLPRVPAKVLSQPEESGPPLPPIPRDVPSRTHITETSSPDLSETSISKYRFEPAAFTEAGAPLRTMMLPPDLRIEFLNLTHPNTARNLETCGILCGTVISNALFISHLIIPDQKSTSDTCDTTEEGDNALFDYCDSEDLLVCGWIHTHPTQTCFLSSRDLHTSSGYQIMLPEAIAIVCAPRHSPDWGIFRLTDPPGLPAVLDCHKPGLFHPHSENNLYTDALRPGHVVEGAGLKFKTVDLRKAR